MICKNCGANINPNDVKCPFCDAMNYTGAEKDYMNKLGDVKKELSSLEAVPDKVMGKKLRRGVVILSVVSLSLLIISSILIFATKRADEAYSREYEDKIERKIAWEETAFRQLDDYYEAGNYNAIIEFSDSLYHNPDTQDFTIYDWAHYGFIDSYAQYSSFIDAFTDFKEGLPGYDITDARYMLISTCEFLYNYTDEQLDVLEEKGPGYSRYGITAAEHQLISDYKAYVVTACFDYLNVSRETIDSLIEEASADGYFNYSICSDSIQALLNGGNK